MLLYLCAPIALLLATAMFADTGHLRAVARAELAAAAACADLSGQARADAAAPPVATRALHLRDVVLGWLPSPASRPTDEFTREMSATLEQSFATDVTSWYARRFWPNLDAFLPAVLVRSQVVGVAVLLALPLFLGCWFAGQYRARLRLKEGQNILPHRFKGWTHIANWLLSTVLLYLCLPVALVAAAVAPIAIAVIGGSICALRSSSIEM